MQRHQKDQNSIRRHDLHSLEPLLQSPGQRSPHSPLMQYHSAHTCKIVLLQELLGFLMLALLPDRHFHLVSLRQTEDQFTSYLGLTHQSAGGVPGGNGGLAGEQALGNPGVLAGVQSCKYVQNGIASKGCVGFVDLGFAEGAPANANHVAGWSSGLSDGVALPQVTTNNPGQAPIDAATSSLPQQFTESSGTVTTYDGYVPSLQTTGNVHAAIVAALKSASLVNP